MSSNFEPIELAKPKWDVNFSFSSTKAQDSVGDIVAQRNEVADRIQKLIERFNEETDTQVALVPYLMNFFHRNGSYDRRSLAILGKVLIRISELLPELEELTRKVEFVNYALSQPEFVASVFCDAEAEIEHFMKSITQSHPPVSGDDQVFDV